MGSKLIAHLYLVAMIVTSVYSQMIMKWRISGCFAGLKVETAASETAVSETAVAERRTS